MFKRFLPPLLLALAGCGPAPAPAPAADAPLVHDGARIRVAASSPLRQALQVAAVQAAQVERPITVPAVIEADAGRLLRIAPPVAGRIVQMHKQLGDAVKRGEPLFTLDSADLAAAFADAGKAQAGLSLAQRNLQRQQALSAAEISARKDLEQAQSEAAQAEAEAGRAQARLAQLGGSLTAPQGRHYTFSAPISGRVVELAGAQGGFWNDTTAPIMTVADLSTVWVTAGVQEKDLAAVFVGQAARITLNAYEGESLSGTVKYVGELLDADTRTVKVRIAVDNRAGRLRPGMFASVVFSGAAHTAVVVPAAALVQSGFNTRVFVEKAAGEFEARSVKTGAQLGDRVEVVSGLQAGERIVVKDGVLLND